jgi:hypothetical protein
MAGLGIQKRGTGIARVSLAKGGKAFPDLNKDGKITRADVLKGRKVPGFKKGGMSKKADMLTAKMSKKKKGKMMKGKR